MELTVESVLAPFKKQPAIKTDTHFVTLRNGKTVEICDSHFGVKTSGTNYNMLTDSRLSTGEVIDRVLRSNIALRDSKNAALVGEIIAEIERLRMPQTNSKPAQNITLK